MASGGADTKVKVVVRVRPQNSRELQLKGCSEPVCQMQDTQTILTNPKDGTTKVFNFDKSFWSSDSSDAHYAGQEDVFADVGTGVLDNAFKGYNACIFAYGQTGSGKTHTMMGQHDDPTQKGIIPRLCDAIFERIQANTNKHLSYKVQVSFMEIYNERVKDLLRPGAGHKLKVRNHSVMGPYVEGLSKLAVTSQQAIDVLMSEGNKVRTTASTNMNDTSSRSHAVFTLILTQALYDEPTRQTGEKVSRLSLVDLAGSERHGKTGTTGTRLQEGANINKSLTTLGLVIKALADQSRAGGKQVFVPYRNSTLTWLLKDNLGGNAKTVMVATISPAADNYEESLSTLRYAHILPLLLRQYRVFCHHHGGGKSVIGRARCNRCYSLLSFAPRRHSSRPTSALAPLHPCRRTRPSPTQSVARSHSAGTPTARRTLCSTPLSTKTPTPSLSASCVRSWTSFVRRRQARAAEAPPRTRRRWRKCD